MKLLFARIGKHSPVSGEEVKKDSVSDVVDFIKASKKDTSFLLTAPYEYDISNFGENLNVLKLAGFTRLEIGNVAGIEDLESFGFTPEKEWKLICN
jgi:excinuclease ABC subunit A